MSRSTVQHSARTCTCIAHSRAVSVSRSRLVVASCVPTAWRFFLTVDRAWRGFFVSLCGASVPVAFLVVLVLWPSPLGAFLWDAVSKDCLFSTDLAFARHELEDGCDEVDAPLLDRLRAYVRRRPSMYCFYFLLYYRLLFAPFCLPLVLSSRWAHRSRHLGAFLGRAAMETNDGRSSVSAEIGLSPTFPLYQGIVACRH